MVYLFARKYTYCLYTDTFLVKNIHIYYLLSSFNLFLGFDSNLVAKVLLVSVSSQGQAYGL